MSDPASRLGLLATIGLGGAAFVRVAAVLRQPEAAANLAWTLGSWRGPADRNSRWQQTAGKRVDPLDRITRGI